MKNQRKLISVDVEDEVNFITSDLEGKVKEVAKNLLEMEKKLEEDGYRNVRIEWISGCNSSWYELWADREETDEEYKERLEKEALLAEKWKRAGEQLLEERKPKLYKGDYINLYDKRGKK